jgi:hypothetical protein
MQVAGDRDFMVSAPGMEQLIASLKHFVPGLRKVQTQQFRQQSKGLAPSPAGPGHARL